MTQRLKLNPKEFGLTPTKSTDRDVGTVMKSPSSRKIQLQADSSLPGDIWTNAKHCALYPLKRKNGKYVYRSLSLTKQEFIDRFRTPFRDKLLSFKCINQREEGPCSLASLFNLLGLYEQTFAIDDIVCPRVTSSEFIKLYKKLGFDMDGYQNWIGFLNSAYVNLSSILQNLTLIPFRVRTYYNMKICPVPPESAKSYNDSLNAFLKQLLDHGYAFAAPFEGHFVVIAGYSETGYLAINSFGNGVGFDGLWLIDPIVHEEYTQENFCNGLTAILLLNNIQNVWRAESLLKILFQ